MTGLSSDIWAKLDVSRESRERITAFVNLLLQWQARINLISPASIPDIWHRHVLDSLQLLPFCPKPLRRLADLGSGSGFPALPLAIASGAEVDLYESNNKKAAFLREVLRVTKTVGHVHVLRLESLATSQVPPVDIVTARALAPLDNLLALAQPFLAAGAVGLFHKGQDLDVELTEAQKSWRIQATRHPSLTDSRAVILEVREAVHERH